MNKNLSKQFLSHIKKFIGTDDERQLINITEVYTDYGEPKNKSPRQCLHRDPLRSLLGSLIKANNYEIEKVIVYKGKNVYVCFDLAFDYLRCLDKESSIYVDNFISRVETMISFFGNFKK